MTEIIIQPKAPTVVTVDASRGGATGPVGPAGPVGPQGVQGPPGPTLAYTHTQNTPSTTWNIAHNLGIFPQVSVVEFGGANIVGDVTYLDTNNIRVTFTAAVSGRAYLS